MADPSAPHEPELAPAGRVAYSPTEIEIRDGRRFTIRPIRPGDADGLQDLVAKTTAEDRRLRFFSPIKRLSPGLLARLTRTDSRHAALVATASEEGREAIFGVARLALGTDGDAEYAVLVRSDLKGLGLGYRLMREILAYARSRGVREVYGEVLRENATMLHMADELGFRRRATDDPGVVEVRATLLPHPGPDPGA